MGRKRKRINNAEELQTSTDHPIAHDLFAFSWTVQEKGIFWGLLAFILSVYTYTLWPTVAGGDSGEITAAAYTLGIIHPPGYPLYTMLGKLFSYLPFGTVGWRVNFLSAVISVGSAAMIYLTVRRLTLSIAASVLAAGLLAFTPLVWRYSILAEVFTLNNLFVSAIIYFFIRFQQEKDFRLVYLMGFLFGLGLSNHHTLIFVGIPLGVWILIQHKEVLLKPSAFLKLFLVSILGLLPYFYLYFASLETPLIAWGDITTWQGFTKHFFRKEYGTFKLATDGTDKSQLLHGLWFYIQTLTKESMVIGWLFIAPAIHWMWKSKDPLIKRMVYLLLGIPLGYLVFFHSLANLPFVDGASLFKDIVSRFWIMPNVIMFIFLGVGAHLFIEKFSEKFPQLKQYALGIALVLIGIQIALHFEKESGRGNYSFAEFGKNLLKPLPEKALFFTLGDINTNTVRYVQQCENYRTDVKVLDRSLMSYPWLKRIQLKHYPDVVLPGVAYNPTHPLAYNFKKLFDANTNRHKVYMTFLKSKGAMESKDKSYEKDYKLLPYGLSFKVEPKSRVTNIESYLAESEPFLVNPDTAFPDPPPPASWEEVIYNNYWLAHHLRAVEVLKYGMGNNFEAKYLLKSKDLIKDLIKRRKSPPADYFKNVGIAHHHMERQTSGPEMLSHRKEMLYYWDKYLRTSSATTNPTYQKIMAIVNAYATLKPQSGKAPASIKPAKTGSP